VSSRPATYREGGKVALQALPLGIGKVARTGVVDMDADLVRQIWLRADRIRVRDRRTPDLTDLVDIASDFGAVDWKLVYDLSILLDRRLGDVERPRVMLEFINELSRRLHPGRVLDPFVVNPAILYLRWTHPLGRREPVSFLSIVWWNLASA
jgi:hypothetical protein